MKGDISDVFKVIKKQNGEAFAKVLRNFGLLGLENLPEIVKYAGHTVDDAYAIIGYLRFTYEHYTSEHPVGVSENPFELLKIAGYDAFEVKTKWQKNSIQKYFAPSEELCTFTDSDRHKTNFIIHAVKYNAASLQRKYFTQPRRQDEYGTSVISIQIQKDGSRISIKNRYNHAVDDPDSTFDNDPDYIIPGLTHALEKYFGIEIAVPKIPLPSHYTSYQNKIVKYVKELNHVYIGDGYYLDNFGIQQINKDSCIQMDEYVLDLQTKTIRDLTGFNNPFVDAFNNEIRGKKLVQEKYGNETSIIADNKEIARIKDGQLISLYMPNLTHADNNFLRHNTALESFNAPNLKEMGDFVLTNNQNLTSIVIPKLTSVGSSFLYNNEKLKVFVAPKLKTIGNSSLVWPKINMLYLPELKTMGQNCFESCQCKNIDLPKIEHIGSDCFSFIECVSINMPNVKEIDDYFAMHAHLKKINAPKLQKVGKSFLYSATEMKELNMPNLEVIGAESFYHAKKLKKIYLPKLQHIDGEKVFFKSNPRDVVMPQMSIKDILLFNKHIIEKLLLSRKLSDQEKEFLQTPDAQEIFHEKGISLSWLETQGRFKDAITRVNARIKQISKRFISMPEHEI